MENRKATSFAETEAQKRRPYKVIGIEKPKTKNKDGEISGTSYGCSIFRDRTETPYGGVAQLGEHLPCKQGVMGSNPIISTKGTRETDGRTLMRRLTGS